MSDEEEITRDDLKDVIVKTVREFVEKDPDNSPVYAPSAPTMITVHFKEKGYRKVKTDPGQEFILRGIRCGKKNDFIAVFDPMDAREYQFVELEDGRLPLLAENVDSFLAKAVGHPDETWKNAKIKFMKDYRRAAAEKAAAEEAKEKQEAEARNATDPLWGMFA